MKYIKYGHGKWIQKPPSHDDVMKELSKTMAGMFINGDPPILPARRDVGVRVKMPYKAKSKVPKGLLEFVKPKFDTKMAKAIIKGCRNNTPEKLFEDLT